MSIRIMSKVWELALRDSEKLVMLALADCANDEGVAWPSMATLARKCGRSDRTCQAVIKVLADKKLLRREEVPGKGCRYYLTPEATAPRSDCAPEKASPPKPTALTPEAAAPKPSKNHSVSNETGGDPPQDPVKALFDVGVSVLTEAGRRPPEARSLIGKWRKQTGDDGAVLAALLACRQRAISEPVEWITRRLNAQGPPKPLNALMAQAGRYQRDAA